MRFNWNKKLVSTIGILAFAIVVILTVILSSDGRKTDLKTDLKSVTQETEASEKILDTENSGVSQQKGETEISTLDEHSEDGTGSVTVDTTNDGVTPKDTYETDIITNDRSDAANEIKVSDPKDAGSNSGNSGDSGDGGKGNSNNGNSDNAKDNSNTDDITDDSSSSSGVIELPIIPID